MLFISGFSCLEINSEGLKALARVIGLNLSKLQRLRMAITWSEFFIKTLLIQI